MQFLLITALLGVAIAACDAWTVDEVKDKINAIVDISQIDFLLPGHKAWNVTYRPTSGASAVGGFLSILSPISDIVGVPGFLSLEDVHLLNVSDVYVNGDIIETGVNEYQIPMHANYKYDLEYNIQISHLIGNYGRACGEINTFSPVIIVRITNEGVLVFIEVKSVTVGTVPIVFSHTKYTKAHDIVFNLLHDTFRSIIEDEVRNMYAEEVSKSILKYVNKSVQEE